jgi:hypothetical protein
VTGGKIADEEIREGAGKGKVAMGIQHASCKKSVDFFTIGSNN